MDIDAVVIVVHTVFAVHTPHVDNVSIFHQQRGIVDLRTGDRSGHHAVAECYVRTAAGLHHLAAVVRDGCVLEGNDGV